MNTQTRHVTGAGQDTSTTTFYVRLPKKKTLAYPGIFIFAIMVMFYDKF